jgi:nicotinamidase-related amidase
MLIIVHPEFPWSSATYLSDFIEAECLRALERIARAAKRARKNGERVVLVTLMDPAEWGASSGHFRLLCAIRDLATDIAPVEVRATNVAASTWVDAIPDKAPRVACGCWTELCVQDVARRVGATINPRMSVRRP